MANAFYTRFKTECLSAGVNLLTSNIKAALIDTGTYTFSAAHDFLDDITGIVATSGNLANKSVTGGVFDADDVTIGSVTGSTPEALILYVDTGTASTSLLIAYIDSVTGLPYTPNGGGVTITWSSGSSKIFAL